MPPRSFAQTRFRPSAGACEILLVRHGESMPFVEGEPFPMLDGQGDPPLSPEGVESARLVAHRLVSTGERIAAVYVTTLQRTHQTAEPLLAQLGIEATVIPELREVFLGDWEGGESRIRFADRDPLALHALEHGDWGIIPGAESNGVFSARIRAGIGRISALHVGEVVVAVVHGGVIARVVADAMGAASGFGVGADNCSVTHLVVADGRWMIRCVNDTSHLWPTFSNADVHQSSFGG